MLRGGVLLKRKIIEIKEELCNGCGLCVDACHEAAIELVDGKARLISDEYCDGLGDCLPECPTGAILMVERDAAAYDEELVMSRIREREAAEAQEAATEQEKPASSHTGCGCPGMAAASIRPKTDKAEQTPHHHGHHHEVPSELRQWPVQLNLVHPQAPYLKEADLLIAADCTAYAYGNFHKEFMQGKVTLIGCPKLDDNHYYTEKLAEIFRLNSPKSITVVRMQVPCCGGITAGVRQAMLDAKTIVPYREVTISADGEIL